MWTLIFVLVLLILSQGAVQYETVIPHDLGGLFVGKVLGRALEVQFVRYRPGRCYVCAKAW